MANLWQISRRQCCRWCWCSCFLSFRVRLFLASMPHPSAHTLIADPHRFSFYFFFSFFIFISFSLFNGIDATVFFSSFCCCFIIFAGRSLSLAKYELSIGWWKWRHLSVFWQALLLWLIACRLSSGRRWWWWWYSMHRWKSLLGCGGSALSGVMHSFPLSFPFPSSHPRIHHFYPRHHFLSGVVCQRESLSSSFAPTKCALLFQLLSLHLWESLHQQQQQHSSGSALLRLALNCASHLIYTLALFGEGELRTERVTQWGLIYITSYFIALLLKWVNVAVFKQGQLCDNDEEEDEDYSVDNSLVVNGVGGGGGGDWSELSSTTSDQYF